MVIAFLTTFVYITLLWNNNKIIRLQTFTKMKLDATDNTGSLRMVAIIPKNDISLSNREKVVQ